MLTQTSELAIKTLMFLAYARQGNPMSPRKIARQLGCSPSYLAKTVALLSKAGFLRSIRGVNGGVVLVKEPGDIRLLQIVEVCQGMLIGNYCSKISSRTKDICSFHMAMDELYQATVQVLSKWTLADLLQSPARKTSGGVSPECRMYFDGFDLHYSRKGKKLE